MVTQTVEDYAKVILSASDYNLAEVVPMGQIADHLSLSPGTVTTMAKRFAKAGWLEYIPRKGCRLTEKGARIAIATLHKHRLVEYFLVKKLGMCGDDVHREAEQLEHGMSQEVIDRLDSFLGMPKEDPHGKPIFRNLEELKAQY